MKKLFSILLVALLLLGAMPQMAAAEESEFKTLIDTYPYVTDSPAYYGELCIVVFEKDGVFYRAEADIPEDIESEIAVMEYNEDFDAQVLALLQDLPIKNVIVLSDCLLPEEALESLKGMTGQQLTDMGFVPTDEVTFGEADTTLVLAKNVFEYTVTFAEAVTPQRVPNLVEVMAPLTVKSAAFTGNLSYYAWDMEYSPDGGIEYVYIAPPAFPLPEIPLDQSPFTTLEDVFATEMDAFSSATVEDLYVIAFEANSAKYRVEAPITPEIQEQLDAIDFFDEDRDEKEKALLGPLPVSRVGDIAACTPSEEELAALVGMTGQELMDMGFEQGMGYNFFDKAEFYLTKDLFEYHVYFNEKVPEMEDYDAVLDEILASLTVAKVEVFGLSSVCSDPDLIW